MTFSLRRKRRTTPPTSPTAAPKATKAVAALACGLGLALGQHAHAQQPAVPAAPMTPARLDAMLKQAQMQVPADVGRTGPDNESLSSQIQLTPPGPERIFGRLDTEAQFQERVRQEALERTPAERVAFPPEPILSTQPYVRRALPPISEIVEPAYTTFNRLYFEQKNFERYGWDLGYITPFVCAGKFFWDVATLPYHKGVQPFRKFDTGAGQCLPGDPVPLVLYPPEISVTGAVLEATTIAGLFAIFPGP